MSSFWKNLQKNTVLECASLGGALTHIAVI